MKNHNMIKIKRVNEERYFRNFSELHRFIARQKGMTSDQLIDHIERMCQMKCNAPLYETCIPMKEGGLINIGNFLCMLSIGNFNRTSGRYQYNLLSIQRTATLTGFDMRELFNYE